MKKTTTKMQTTTPTKKATRAAKRPTAPALEFSGTAPAGAPEPPPTSAPAPTVHPTTKRTFLCPLCNATHTNVAFFLKQWVRGQKWTVRPEKVEADEAWLVAHVVQEAHWARTEERA